MMKKSVIIIFYILFHIFILREVRNYIFTTQVNENLLERVEKNENISITKLDVRLINFHYQDSALEKIWSYKIPLGSYFFISIIALILIGAQKEFFLFLIGIHLVVVIIASIIFALGFKTGFWSLVIIDLLSRYLIPFCSLGIVPLAFILKRHKESNG